MNRKLKMAVVAIGTAVALIVGSIAIALDALDNWLTSSIDGSGPPRS